jgi:hypothetical protein
MKLYRNWCVECGHAMVFTHTPPRNVFDYTCPNCHYSGAPFVSVEPVPEEETRHEYQADQHQEPESSPGADF